MALNRMSAAKGAANLLGLRTPSRYRNERTRTNRPVARLRGALAGGMAQVSGVEAPGQIANALEGEVITTDNLGAPSEHA